MGSLPTTTAIPTPSHPLRLAILECDTPLTQTKTKYGSYGGVFKALFEAAAKSLGWEDGSLQVSMWDVVNGKEYPSLDEDAEGEGKGKVDGIVISGSRYSSFENTPWIERLVAYTQSVLKQDRVRLVGVCFGHQIIGRAMGVEVGRNSRGWEVSVCDVDLTAEGKRVFRVEKLRLHQMHKDIVYAYPPEVIPLGYSPTCEVQGMLVPGRVVTVQGHPEFTEDIVRELLVTRHEQGIFSNEVFEDAVGRVAGKQDGVLVAEAFLRFLVE